MRCEYKNCRRKGKKRLGGLAYLCDEHYLEVVGILKIVPKHHVKVPRAKFKTAVARAESLNQLSTAYRPKINACEVDINNSFKHELGKFLALWMIRNKVPANQLEDVFDRLRGDKRFKEFIKMINEIVKEFEVKEMVRPAVVTEARFKIGRRADLFVLDTKEIIEIETSRRRKKKGIVLYI